MNFKLVPAIGWKDAEEIGDDGSAEKKIEEKKVVFFCHFFTWSEWFEMPLERYCIDT